MASEEESARVVPRFFGATGVWVGEGVGEGEAVWVGAGVGEG